MSRLFICIYFLLTTTIGVLSAQDSNLRKDIASIIENKKATVGVAIIYNGTDTLTVNNQYRYPMMSVYKFHLALAILDNLDKRGLSLDQQIYVPQSALYPNTHSPLRDAKPEGNFYMTARELLKYSVALSDNNACDILFSFLGSTDYVEHYIKNLGIQKIAITKTEKDMSANFDYQYDNWTTPYAAVELLKTFHQQKLFAPVYKDFLWNTLIETSTGKDKIKGLLPEGTIVGHKTGMSSRNSNGVKAADNDLGFIILPNGRILYIAVFIVNSVENDATNASIIAQISKAAYDYYKVK